MSGRQLGMAKLALNSHYGPTVFNAPSQEIVIVLMEDVHGLGLQRRLVSSTNVPVQSLTTTPRQSPIIIDF